MSGSETDIVISTPSALKTLSNRLSRYVIAGSLSHIPLRSSTRRQHSKSHFVPSFHSSCLLSFRQSNPSKFHRSLEMVSCIPHATDVVQEAVRKFSSKFNTWPTHAGCAPGRVNLIGEHTDYNDGFVLPMVKELQY